MEHFSNRYGFRSPEPEISIREDAPEGLRTAILLLTRKNGMTPAEIRMIICEVLLVRPDPSNWSPYPNIWDEANRLIDGCDWFKVYDIAEAVYMALAKQYTGKNEFEEALTQYFRDNGIGWQMVNGQIVYRGSEPFSITTHEAVDVLTQTGRPVAANEIHEALRDISRRPKPDISGAIQHCITALECTARDVMGKPKWTLGDLLPHLGLTPPLDSAVEKLWGYSSNNARHIKEGTILSSHDAELVVSIACAVCTYLSKQASASST